MGAVETLKDLIAIKSYSGEEAAIRDYIESKLKGWGLDTERQGDNLVARVGGKDPSRALIMNSHMDTVSAGDLSKWSHDPWRPVIKQGRITGLGASDMKSGMAASMEMAHQLVGEGTPEVDTWFTFVVNEEVDGTGTREFADWFVKSGWMRGYKDVVAVFAEPTGLKEVEHGNRGNIFILLESSGDSGHSSRPDGVKKHSVMEMYDFGRALQDQVTLWAAEFSGTPFVPPTVGLFTSIEAGMKADGGVLRPESMNKFPSMTRATFDLRTVPGFHEVAMERIRGLAAQYGIKVVETYPAPAGYTDPSEKIVTVAREVLGGAGLVLSQGATDLGFLSQIGIKGVIFGPGEIKQAHQPNEFVWLNKLERSVDAYRQTLDKWGKGE